MGFKTQLNISMGKEVLHLDNKETSITSDREYKKLLLELKEKVRSSQLKAAIKVNYELLDLYWTLGEYIVKNQEQHSWGDSFIKSLAKDLQKEFPDMKGFSETNIKYIRRWYSFYIKWLQGVAELENNESDSKELKTDRDNATIGLIICKDKNDVVCEYSLEQISQPIGISKYEITKLFEAEYKSSLPSIEEIEKKIKEIDMDN